MSIGLRSFYQLIIANLAMAVVTVFRFKNLPPQIPLFYSKPPGEEQLADTWFILILPILMNLLFILNKFIFAKYFKQDEFVEKIFYFVNMFIIISFTLIFVKIIFLVT